MSRVIFDHVTKHFGEVVAVDDLSLEVLDKEFLVLLGPSGCGKTTALRVVAGLEEPTDGVVVIGDRIVNNVEAKNRDIAMVFQNYALYPHMSVYDNLAFGLRMRHVSRRDRDGKVRDVARLLGLDQLLRRRPGELSGGQRQRVAVGRAIVREPAVFLMDEPLSNLDAKLRVQTRAEVIKLHRRLETTVIYVTHDQVEAMTMGQRIAIMNEGALQQVAPPQQVYDRPATMFVAEFIGSPAMNFFQAELSRKSGELMCCAERSEFTVPKVRASALEAHDSRGVVVGVRPEHLALVDGEEAAGDSVIKATVDTVESLGHELNVLFSDGSNNVVARLDTKRVLQYGDEVRLAVQGENLHFFDPETGQRIE
jgi:multiple sugar transport system ATP-binding protein